MKLVVFADYVCPYCYLAHCELERLADRVTVEPRAFELRPPGTPLMTADTAWLAEAWRTSVEPLARSVGVDMTFRSPALRTRKAHEATAFARAEGVAGAMNAAIYHAYWQEGHDIGRIDVLVEVGMAAGLDRTALKVALDIDQMTEQVEQDEAWALQYGFRGVPAYLKVADHADVKTQLRAGVQKYEDLIHWMESA